MRVALRLAAVALLAAAPVAFTVGVAGAASPSVASVSHTINVDPNPVTAGQNLALSGSGCVSGAEPSVVTLTITAKDAAADKAEIKPNADGTWKLSAKTNPDAAVGVHQINATCDYYNGSFDYDAATVTVYSPNGAPTITVSDLTPELGESVTVTGQNYRPGENVEVILHSTPVVLATLAADSAGAVSGTVTIPSATELGAHTVTLEGETSGLTASVAITVDPVPPSGPALANTGVPTSEMITIGLAFAVAGAGVLAVSRRRRADQSI